MRAGAGHQRAAARSASSARAGSAPCSRAAHPRPRASSSQTPADPARWCRSARPRSAIVAQQLKRVGLDPVHLRACSSGIQLAVAGPRLRAPRGWHPRRSRARTPGEMQRETALVGTDIQRAPVRDCARQPRSSAADRETPRSSARLLASKWKRRPLIAKMVVQRALRPSRTNSGASGAAPDVPVRACGHPAARRSCRPRLRRQHLHQYPAHVVLRRSLGQQLQDDQSVVAVGDDPGISSASENIRRQALSSPERENASAATRVRSCDRRCNPLAQFGEILARARRVAARETIRSAISDPRYRVRSPAESRGCRPRSPARRPQPSRRSAGIGPVRSTSER